MSPQITTIATNSFLSWVREGIAASLPPLTYGVTTHPRRAAATVGMDVNGAAIGDVALQLYGPGDVVGIDPRLVVRTTPLNGSTDFEPNYFPAIEFAHPGLPWLFTPGALSDQKVLPWLCLVVVRRQDGVTFEEPDPARPLPVIRFEAPARPADELPPLEEAWAWAHGHVSWARDPQASGAALKERLAELLRDNPQQTVSRLLCPRRLEAGVQYHACVVPVFDLGVKAGLGLATASDDAPGVLQLAWRSDSPPPLPFRLPVYYRWEFTAGAAGDFASLVRRIAGRAELPGVGRRALDVSHAGPPALDMPGVTLGLEGALRPPGMQPSAWDATARDRFQRALTPLLDAPATGTSAGGPTGVPVVAPPLYGGSQTGRRTVPPPTAGEPHAWLRELNLDPRHRAAAAFGAAIVQRDQEQLMASAWAQLAELRQLNRMLQQTQLAREIASVTHRKRLEALSPAAVVAVTRPALARVGTPDPTPSGLRAVRAGVRGTTFRTFHAWVADSPITAGGVSAAFQSIARPNGPVARRLFAPDQPVSSELVRRLNAKRIVAAPPRAAPAGTVAVDTVTEHLKVQYGTKYERVRLREATPAKLSGIGLGWTDDWSYHNAPPETPLTTRLAGGTAGLMRDRDDRDYEPPPPRLPKRGATGRAALVAAFAAAARAHQDYLLRARDLLDPPAEKEPFELTAVKSQLLVELDPEETLKRRANGRVAADPEDRENLEAMWARPDPLDPLLAAPRFPQPMADPLAQISEELILPGAEHVPPDTMAALEPNHRFIEAFLVGLNQEMSNELLWRGYAGDLGATYFRHFWDTGGAMPRPAGASGCADGEDFQAIRDWIGTALGANACGASADSRLVLLLRSEALRRYPSATIYAVKAVRRDGRRVPGGEEKYPLFRGTLHPDITYLGFDITAAEARGTGAAGDDGYYFVIQQHPFAPLFGLAASRTAGGPPRWSALAWEDLGASATHLRIAAATPAPADPGELAWGRNAAHMAAITMRAPVRVARHASLMLGQPL